MNVTFPVKLILYEDGKLSAREMNELLIVTSEQLSDLASRHCQAGSPPIAECLFISDPKRRRTHLVSDPKIAEAEFFPMHRKGPREDPFYRFKPRSCPVFGAYGFPNLFAEDTPILHEAVKEYFPPSRLKELREEWLAECENRINDWKRAGKIFLVREISTLACALFAKSILGYGKDTRRWAKALRKSDEPSGAKDSSVSSKVFEFFNKKENEKPPPGIPFLRRKIGKLIDRFAFSQEGRYTLIHHLLNKKFLVQTFDEKEGMVVRECGLDLKKRIVEDVCISLLFMSQKLNFFWAGIIEEYSANRIMQDVHFQEIGEAWKKSKGDMAAFLARIECLRKTCLEGLRLYPPLIPEREAACDMQLLFANKKRHVIRKGDRIIWFPRFATSCWSDPKIFDPGRDISLYDTQVLSFGKGPHSCLGERLVHEMTMIAISTLLLKAEVKMPENVRRPPIVVSGQHLRFEEDFKMLVTKRL